MEHLDDGDRGMLDGAGFTLEGVDREALRKIRRNLQRLEICEAERLLHSAVLMCFELFLICFDVTLGHPLAQKPCGVPSDYF